MDGDVPPGGPSGQTSTPPAAGTGHPIRPRPPCPSVVRPRAKAKTAPARKLGADAAPHAAPLLGDHSGIPGGRHGAPPVEVRAPPARTARPVPGLGSLSEVRGQPGQQSGDHGQPPPAAAAGSGAPPSLGHGLPERADDPLVYVISVCDGVGGAFLAVRRYTTRIRGWAVERKRHLAAFVRSQWPQLHSTALVEEVTVAEVLRQIVAPSPDVILLIGGVPCQPFSGLASDPQGFRDERPAPIYHFVRIRDGVSEGLPSGLRDSFYWLMEEVASMSRGHRDQISGIVGAQPILFQAADKGWIHRPRLYWGLDIHTLLSAPQKAGVEELEAGSVAEDLCVIRWTGAPDPPEWSPHDGFAWRCRGESGTRALAPPTSGYAPLYPGGRFLILTTAFPHPADLPPRSRDDPNFYQRWLDDGRAQPLYTYVKGNMVWKGSEGRPLNIEEAEELMGYPAAYTASLQPRATESANMARRHAVGNGFHIPSVALLLSLLVLPHRTAATPWGAGMAVSPEASRDGLAYGPWAPQCAHQGDSGRLATDAVHGPGRIPPSSRAPRFADQVAREALDSSRNPSGREREPPTEWSSECS